MSRIAVVMASQFEDVEYTDPAEMFGKQGHELTVISPERGETLEGKQGEAKVKSDHGIAEAKPADFDALFIPGGFSPDILRADERFVNFARHFADEEKPILAICHGPQLLITAGVLNGRTVTGFKSIQVDLRNAGAEVRDEQVVTCGGNLVTSRQPDDLPAFIQRSLEVLSQHAKAV